MQQFFGVPTAEPAQRIDLLTEAIEHLAHPQFVDHGHRRPAAIAASSSRSIGAAHTSTSSAIRPTRLSNSTRAGSSLLYKTTRSAQYPAQETDRGAVEHRHLDPADAGVRHERVRNSRRHPFGIS